jgi:hypothetical protein
LFIGWCVEGASFDPKELDEILPQLRFAWVESLPKTPAREQAANRLKQIGTNALPALLDRVKTIDRVNATNSQLAHKLADELEGAFKVLGKDASPILPDLIKEFKTGRCNTASIAIAQIGGADAVHTFTEALTNADFGVKLSALASIQILKRDPNAKDAIGPLTTLLKDQTNSLRAEAAITLGALATEPERSIPVLLTAAERDTNSIVRAVAVKAIGKFGSSATVAKTRLQQIASNDPDVSVRREAYRVLDKL